MEIELEEEKKIEEEANRCPICGSRKLIYDYERGEVVCSECGGVVQSKLMDQGPEWRAFTQEEKEERSRTGIPLSFSIHDKGLSTTITNIGKDAFGRSLSVEARLQMLRLRHWQIRSRVHSSIDRNLSQAMAELDRLSDRLGLPSPVKEKAAIIYRKALEAGLVRGRSIAAIAAASLYAACRSSSIPRTLKELAEASIVKKKDIARCYRLLIKELNLKMPVADPVKYVAKISSKLGLSESIQRRAIEILRKCQELKACSGKDPVGLAAAALYMACVDEGGKITQKEIAEAAEVTEVTIRNRYNGLRRVLGAPLSGIPQKL
jgi:transcription initiation factor TFIIB